MKQVVGKSPILLIELGDPMRLGDAVELGDPMMFCDPIGLGKSNVKSLLDVRVGSSASFPSFVFDDNISVNLKQKVDINVSLKNLVPISLFIFSFQCLPK